MPTMTTNRQMIRYAQLNLEDLREAVTSPAIANRIGAIIEQLDEIEEEIEAVWT